MKASVYTRPKTARFIPVRKRKEISREDHTLLNDLQRPIEVSGHTECHITPPTVAQRMAEYLDAHPYESVLEPSAGTGNLVYALLQHGHDPRQICAVERHMALKDACDERFNHRIATFNQCFLDFAKMNQWAFPYALMNPPFKQVRRHMNAAISCLAPGGTLVALVPNTYEYAGMETLEILPPDTFAWAKVYTKIVRIEHAKQTD